MKRSVDRILTTHTGSLPRPPDLVAMILAHEKGEDDPRFPDRLHGAVADIVQQERDADVDVINDGEQGKINYYTYINERLTGFEGDPQGGPMADVLEFPGFERRLWWATQEAQQNVRMLACNGPISVKTLEPLKRDIKNLQDATASTAAEEVFMSAVSPGLIASGHGNSYYPTREEFLEAVAEAMRQEYEAIANAGFVLHLDCPDLAMGRHLFYKEKSLEEFRRLAAENVDALNYATRNIDPDQMRMHLCWGNYEGPHHKDIPLQDILDVVLSGRPNGIAVEAANPRHAHEWRVFEDNKLPDGKIIIPGVLDSTSNYIEHPEVVADRLVNYARTVGQENVIAGTDCGFGTAVGLDLVDPNVTWAKFKSMAEGARIATQRLAAVGA